MTISSTDLFAALAHDTRLRCVLLLLSHEELCVCELTQAVGAAQPHVSRHLAQLREVGLVVDRREGLWIYYRLNPGLPMWVFDLLRATADGVGGQAPYVEDVSAFGGSSNRRGIPRCA